VPIEITREVVREIPVDVVREVEVIRNPEPKNREPNPETRNPNDQVIREVQVEVRVPYEVIKEVHIPTPGTEILCKVTLVTPVILHRLYPHLRPERLVFYCRTTSASTALRTPRRTCCPCTYVVIADTP